MEIKEKGIKVIKSWRADWNKFIRDGLGVSLDNDQQEIVSSVQFNPRTSVVSGTARGKDYVAACVSICFLYLTPEWEYGQLIKNTKVALTAPTARQVKNIMMPEIGRLFNKAKSRGLILPGRLTASDIRTDYEEWFLTGFKADEYNHEAWSGFHAVNTMFVVTEASGISDDTFGAIEGNLQGNSRVLLVFNANSTTGYAANSQRSERWSKFRLNSLTAPNVVSKDLIIPGQVDYEWVKDKIDNWCTPISKSEIIEEMDDFEFENVWYRPEDLFRIKVLGKFPKVAEDILIPEQWVKLAEDRWRSNYDYSNSNLILGSDIAGMGRDSSVDCFRYEKYILKFTKNNSGGKANHMESAGKIKTVLDSNPKAIVSIDTIGEGAGVYSRLEEQGYGKRIISCKYSEGAKDHRGDELTDITGQYKFANMRAYLFWALRDWLDPKNQTGAMVPPNSGFANEASQIKYRFRSDGKIIIEPKEDIKKRLGYSIDLVDACANTFYPIPNIKPVNPKELLRSFR